jgi:hypothetical protein
MPISALNSCSARRPGQTSSTPGRGSKTCIAVLVQVAGPRIGRRNVGRPADTKWVDRPMTGGRSTHTVPTVAIRPDAQATKGNRSMQAPTQTRDHRRFRLAANDNETIVADRIDVEGHSLTRNDNEIIVDAPGMRQRNAPEAGNDELDTEGHRLATNDNETMVRTRRLGPQDGDDELSTPGMRRLRAR